LARTLSARPPLLGPFRLGHPRDRNHRLGPFGSDPSGSASLAWSLDSVVRCGPLGSVPSARSLDSIVSLGPLGSVSSGPASSDRPSPPRIGSPCDLVLGRAGPRHLAALAAPGLASVVGHFGRRSRRSSVAQVLGRVDRRSRWSSVARSSVASVVGGFDSLLHETVALTASISRLGHSAAATGARLKQASFLALFHARRRCVLRRSIESCVWPLGVLGAGSFWHSAAIGRLGAQPLEFFINALRGVSSARPRRRSAAASLSRFGAWPFQSSVGYAFHIVGSRLRRCSVDPALVVSSARPLRRSATRVICR
jgi:hypothetical protein